MPKIKINGKEFEAKPGQKVIEVAEENGIHIPHYCYHPGLKPHGNCRMCLCKVSNSRKLEVSCMYPATEGLEVETEGAEVDKGRKSVMEYMLINHPLDCPICDKAGECMLQNQTKEYRHGLSRFEEPKVIKDTKDLGPNVKIWGCRCISCTRCVRFCEDVVGTGELSMTQRGDHQVADVHPEVPLENPMSLNVVDLCPVGALIDKNFLYAARVWFAKRVDTVCAGCSKGCNLTATVHHNDLKRVQPRENHEVNGYWMCDAGRLNLGYLKGERRLKLTKGHAKDLAARLAPLAGKVGIIATTYATVEEAWLIRQLAEKLQAKVGFRGVTGGTWTSKSGWTIEADKTPNRAGVGLLFDRIEGTEAIEQGLAAGQIEAILWINGIPGDQPPASLVDAVSKAQVLAVADIEKSALSERAQYVFASATWAEKNGTYVNSAGRAQRIQPLIVLQGQARTDVVWMQEVLVGLGARSAVVPTEALLTEALGVDYARLGKLGFVPGGTAAERAVTGGK